MTIQVEVQQHLATVTLNRADKHNALTAEMMEAFVKVFQALEEDPSVHVIVLTGAGDKAFCSGADLGGMSENNEQSILTYKQHVSKFQRCLLALYNCSKPTIAVVNGYALAGGFGLAAACDITFASEQSTFGAPEINVGLWGMMISACLVDIIGRKKTLELLYTGKKISAKEAHELGLVNDVFPAEQLAQQVENFTTLLVQKNPTALSMGKESLQLAQSLEYEKALTYLRDQVLILGETKDSKEGMKAFLEKRAPIWSGK